MCKCTRRTKVVVPNRPAIIWLLGGEWTYLFYIIFSVRSCMSSRCTHNIATSRECSTQLQCACVSYECRNAFHCARRYLKSKDTCICAARYSILYTFFFFYELKLFFFRVEEKKLISLFLVFFRKLLVAKLSKFFFSVSTKMICKLQAGGEQPFRLHNREWPGMMNLFIRDLKNIIVCCRRIISNY